MSAAQARSTDHERAVRARARRIRRADIAHSRGFRSTLRLTLIAVYSIAFMWSGFFDWAGSTETVLWVISAVLWVWLLVLFLRELGPAPRKWHYAVRHLSIPLLLIAPGFIWLVWLPVSAFVIVVIAYLLELRNHSAGDGFLFSLGLVVFVGLFAGLSMVEIENDDATATLRTPSDGLFWAFASLLKLNFGGRTLAPVTEDGQDLAVVVGVCAVLGASLFTAQVISWVIGSEDKKRWEKESVADEQSGGTGEVLERLAAIQFELAELRDLVGQSREGTAAGAPAVELRNERAERP